MFFMVENPPDNLTKLSLCSSSGKVDSIVDCASGDAEAELEEFR